MGSMNLSFADGARLLQAVHHSDYRFAKEKRRRLAAEKKAATDPLTQLLNRKGGQERFVSAIAEARRHGQNLGVIFFDLDHFKVANDTHGHAVGDTVLTAVADVLRTTLRMEDLKIRWGGDEFVVVLQQPIDDPAARLLAERLRGAIEARFQQKDFADKGIKVTASMGLICFNPKALQESLANEPYTPQAQPEAEIMRHLLAAADQGAYFSGSSGDPVGKN